MTSTAVASAVWSTAGIPHDQRNAAWADKVGAELFPVSTDPIDDRPFEASLGVTELGGLTLLELAGSAHRIRPDGPAGGPDDDGLLVLNAQLTGRSVAHAHTQSVTVAAGHLALLAGSWPTAVELPEGFEQLILKIPSELLAPRLACPQEALGRTIAGDGCAGLFLNTLGYLARNGARLDRQARSLVAGQLLDLLTVTFGQVSTPGRRGRLLLQAALDETVRRLGDSELDITQIAGHVHVSVRYLQRLLAEQGTTFGRWTAQQRIVRCRADFDADPDRQTATAVIAARWGFVDRSHFSRVFSAHTGVSPRQYRREVRSARPGNPDLPGDPEGRH